MNAADLPPTLRLSASVGVSPEMTATFDAFAAAACSDALKTPLEMALNAVAAKYRTIWSSLENCERVLALHDASHPLENHIGLSALLVREIDDYRSGVLNDFIEATHAALGEGRAIDLAGLSIASILGICDKAATVPDILARWDPLALIKARDELIGPSLDVAAWIDAVKRAAEAVSRRPDAFNPKRMTILTYGQEIIEGITGGYRFSGRTYQFAVHFSALMNLAEAIAAKNGSVAKAMHPLSQHELIGLKGLDTPYRAQELFRWHSVRQGLVSRFRPYKEGGLLVEFTDAELVRALEAELGPVINARGLP